MIVMSCLDSCFNVNSGSWLDYFLYGFFSPSFWAQSEENCYITDNSCDTFTITRSEAGTSNITHASGATVRHVLTSDDLDYFRDGVTTADAAIPASTLTTKGDLLTRTSASLARLSVGSNGQVLAADSTTSTGLTWSTPISQNLTINAKTTNYSLIAGDANKLITMTSSSATTITIPNGVFTTGQQINVASLGTGITTIASDGTSVVTGTPGLILRAQYSTATIICTATNTFLVAGDLSA
jgi:hypothetical protein